MHNSGLICPGILQVASTHANGFAGGVRVCRSCRSESPSFLKQPYMQLPLHMLHSNQHPNKITHPCTDRDVASGGISMSVSFIGVPIYEGSDDLCAKTACPIKPGPIEINYLQELPPIAPPVSVVVWGCACARVHACVRGGCCV